VITEKKYIKPHTVHEAIIFAQENIGSFSFLAGGTDVIVNKLQGNDESNCLIDISGINELTQVYVEEGHLKIGSMTKLGQLQNHSFVRDYFPSLIEAANSVASPMLRKTATIGGNLLCENRCIFFNQNAWWREAIGFCLKCEGDTCIATGGKKACFSKFVSDTATVLISLNATVSIQSPNHLKIVPVENLYTGNGIIHYALEKTDIVTWISIPLDPEMLVVFKKLRPRESVDFTSLTTAVSMAPSGKLKIVLGGVDPGPVILEGTIHGDQQALIKLAQKGSRIVANDYYSRGYRREMIRVYLEESFEELNSKLSYE
jgi:4-hydroxybenzoyl-CoA reductase beta subunit